MYQKAKSERTIFLVGAAFSLLGAVLFVVYVLPYLVTEPSDYATMYQLFYLLGRAAFMYFTFRLSRFLKQKWWMILILVAIAPFSGLYLIPLIILWSQANKTIAALGKVNSMPF